MIGRDPEVDAGDARLRLWAVLAELAEELDPAALPAGLQAV